MLTLRWLAHLLIIRPVVWIVIGINLRHGDRLPRSGPAIVVANHNNHADTMVLMALFPMRQVLCIRAVAAADYFLSNRVLAWVALNIFGIIPVKRSGWRRSDGDPLASCARALDRGEILIIYPEGTRGEPERMVPFKNGFAHLACRHPDVPVVPVLLHGLGKILPKGAVLPVPFVCDVVVGSPVRSHGEPRTFALEVQQRIAALADEACISPWE